MSENATAPTSVQAMTADQAANAIESMLSGNTGEQQEQEALMDDEESSDIVDTDDSAEDDAAEEEVENDESEDEAVDEQPKEPTKFTVKVDGKEVEVTLDELQKGYSRTEDYTRKTQALAQERKAAQAELESVRNERAQYAQLLDALQAQLQQTAQPQVDMDRLYSEDPIEWVRQRELQRMQSEKLSAIQMERQRLEAEQKKEFDRVNRERLSQERDLLLSAAPELKDSKTAAKAKSDWLEAGKSVGFTEDEVNSITDHRLLLALRKIAAYDSMVSNRKAAKPQPVVAEKRSVAPGVAPKSKQQSSVIKSTAQRLRTTGNVRDAASLIEKLM